MNPIIFSTGSLWTYGVERCFGLAAAAGFDGIELMVDQRWDTRQASYLSDLIDRHGLPVVAVHSPFLSVPGWPAGNPGRIRQSVALAEAIGASVVVHHLPWRIGSVWVHAGRRFFPAPVPFWNPDAAYRRWLLEEYASFQYSTPVKLCIENMPAFERFGRRWDFVAWNTPEKMAQFRYHTLDTTHLGTWGLQPADVWPRFGGRVRHIHLSNYNGKEHRYPADGELDLARFLRLARESGYDGAVSLELHPDALDAGASDTSVLEKMESSLALIRHWLDQPTKGMRPRVDSPPVLDSQPAQTEVSRV